MTTHLPTESLARVHSLVAWNQESHEGPSTTVEAAPAANMENLLNTLFTRFDTQALASLREQAKLERLEDDEEKYDEEEYDEEEELDEEEQEEAERSAIMADLARRVNELDEEEEGEDEEEEGDDEDEDEDEEEEDEDEEEEDEDEDEEEEDEEELEVFEFTYNGTNYYATDTTTGTLYENLDGEVGDQIGSLRKGVPFLC